jgi:spore maturation protein CgeB
MNILWARVDRSARVARHLFEELPNEVARHVNVTFLNRSLGDDLLGPYQRKLQSGLAKPNALIWPYLQNSRQHFDFLMIDAIMCFDTEPWKDIRVPKGVLVGDLHNRLGEIDRAIQYGADIIFHKYKLPLYIFHPTAPSRAKNLVWLPHSVNTEVFKPAPFKFVEVLHTGRVHPAVYPARAKSLELLRDKDYFVRVERPDETPYATKKWPVDDAYADLIASSKICICGGSIYHYPVQKYFEISASDSLLVSDWFEELGMLGFKPQHNMVVIDLYNLDTQMESLLKHSEERCRVAENARELMHKYHSVKVRAKQFINHVCDVLERPHMYEVEYDFYKEFGSDQTKDLEMG